MKIFPQRTEQVTAQSLTALLSSAYPGLVVTECEVLKIILGTATKMHLQLSFNKEAAHYTLPAKMWLKAGLEDHSEQNLSLYALETAFYRDIAPALSELCPKAYFAETDPTTGQSVILLEDLLDRNFQFRDALSPLNVDQAKLVLDQLAKVHAKYWRSNDLDKFPWLPEGSSLRDSGAIQFLFSDANWPRMMALPRNQDLPEPLQDRESMSRRMLSLLDRLAENTHCLIHGDAHAGNLGFVCSNGSSDTALLFDWQTIMKGHWAHDVAHFLISALDTNLRREHEQALLAYYLQRLQQLGVDAPNWETAWQAYRQHALYSYSWMLCPPEWQPEEICAVCADRAIAAITDLSSLELWDNQPNTLMSPHTATRD